MRSWQGGSSWILEAGAREPCASPGRRGGGTVGSWVMNGVTPSLFIMQPAGWPSLQLLFSSRNPGVGPPSPHSLETQVAVSQYHLLNSPLHRRPQAAYTGIYPSDTRVVAKLYCKIIQKCGIKMRGKGCGWKIQMCFAECKRNWPWASGWSKRSWKTQILHQGWNPAGYGMRWNSYGLGFTNKLGFGQASREGIWKFPPLNQLPSHKKHQPIHQRDKEPAPLRVPSSRNTLFH